MAGAGGKGRSARTPPASEAPLNVAEAIYDGERIFARQTEKGPWEESTNASGLSALLMGPSLSEVASWLLSAKDAERLLEVWAGEDDHLIRRARHQVTQVQVTPYDDGRRIGWERSADIYFYDYNAPIAIQAPETE